MRKVCTSFICLLLSTLGAIDTKEGSRRVEGGGREKIFLVYFIIFNK